MDSAGRFLWALVGEIQRSTVTLNVQPANNRPGGQSIFGLRGWASSGDVSAGAGPAVDLAVSKSFTVGSAQLGPTTATVTVGPGVGTKAAVGSIGYTFVPKSFSTKCGG
jgi:hypothetical protein